MGDAITSFGKQTDVWLPKGRDGGFSILGEFAGKQGSEKG